MIFAARVLRLYHLMPERLRLVSTAVLGAAIGWLTYELLYRLNPFEAYRATTSWFLGFVIGVARQHALHRTLTFTHETPYWRSLGRAYLFYSVSAVLGAFTNYYLTAVLGLHHRAAWLICLVITAGISLLCLKRLVFAKN